MLRKVWIPKSIARKPTLRIETYLKYGFVITECKKYLCPRCGTILSAGANYQPKYCDQCGQKVSFKGSKWKEENELGFAERRQDLEQVEDRVVRSYMESDYGMSS